MLHEITGYSGVNCLFVCLINHVYISGLFIEHLVILEGSTVSFLLLFVSINNFYSLGSPRGVGCLFVCLFVCLFSFFVYGVPGYF